MIKKTFIAVFVAVLVFVLVFFGVILILHADAFKDYGRIEIYKIESNGNATLTETIELDKSLEVSERVQEIYNKRIISEGGKIIECKVTLYESKVLKIYWEEENENQD